MLIPTNYFLEYEAGSRNKPVLTPQALSKNELKHLAVYLILKSKHDNGVIICQSKRKLAQSIGIHYSVFDKALAYFEDNDLMEWTTCKKQRAIRLFSLLGASTYTKYRAHLANKFRKEVIINKTFDEVITFISEIVLKIQTAQQSFKADEAIDRNIVADKNLIKSPDDLIKRKRMVKKYGSHPGAIDKSSYLTIVSQRLVAEYLGISVPTTAKRMSKMKHDKLAFFIPLEKRITPMTYDEYVACLRANLVSKRQYIHKGWLCQNMGSCYYHIKDNSLLKDDVNTINKMDVDSAIRTVISNRNGIVLGDNDIKGMLYSLYTANTRKEPLRIEKELGLYKDR